MSLGGRRAPENRVPSQLEPEGPTPCSQEEAPREAPRPAGTRRAVPAPRHSRAARTPPASRHSGAQGHLGGDAQPRGALRAQTQKPGLGSDAGCAASRLVDQPLTTSGPRVPHRDKGPSSHWGRQCLVLGDAGPVPGLLSSRCPPAAHVPLPTPQWRATRQDALPVRLPCCCFPFLGPISFCILDTFWGPLN